ncbi:MAG: SCO family protein [Pseudomonadota bacterium]
MQHYLPTHYLVRQRGSSTANSLLPILVAFVALSIGFFLYQQGQDKTPEVPEFQRIILLPAARELSDFSLQTHLDGTFSKQDLRGKWSLIFFGFTHCPDICPTTLLALRNVRNQLEASGQWPDMNVLMVSVDPERDTVSRLSQYVPFFHPEFLGITGDEPVITEFAKQLGILIRKNTPDENGYYDVDHGASLILINPQGQYAGVVTAPHQESAMLSDFDKLGQLIGRSSTTSQPEATQTESSDVSNTKPQLSTDTNIAVSNSWIRHAPPSSSAYSAYLELRNDTDRAIEITGVKSPDFGMAMIHDTIIEDGLASMEHLDSITLEANQTLTLAPMATHIMLMRPQRSINLGDQIPISLTTKSGEYDFLATVKESAAN